MMTAEAEKLLVRPVLTVNRQCPMRRHRIRLAQILEQRRHLRLEPRPQKLVPDVLILVVLPRDDEQRPLRVTRLDPLHLRNLHPLEQRPPLHQLMTQKRAVRRPRLDALPPPRAAAKPDDDHIRPPILRPRLRRPDHRQPRPAQRHRARPRPETLQKVPPRHPRPSRRINVHKIIPARSIRSTHKTPRILPGFPKKRNRPPAPAAHRAPARRTAGVPACEWRGVLAPAIGPGRAPARRTAGVPACEWRDQRQLRRAGDRCPQRERELAVTMHSERGRLARSRRPNHGRESFARRAKWSLNGAPKAVVSPTVSGLSTP